MIYFPCLELKVQIIFSHQHVQGGMKKSPKWLILLKHISIKILVWVDKASSYKT